MRFQAGKGIGIDLLRSRAGNSLGLHECEESGAPECPGVWACGHVTMRWGGKGAATTERRRSERVTTTILLIRHGETAWNRQRIFRGTHDIPLNENGLRQARLLAGALRRRPIEAAYTSPLSRARQTAEVVLDGRDVPAVVDERLTDFCYGDWQGMQESEVARRWPREFALWSTRPHEVRVPGGNTLREVCDVAFEALEAAAARHEGETVALFAHRVVNKLLVLAALGLGLDRFPFVRQDNCCLTEFQRTPAGYVLCVLNDTGHMRGDSVGLLTADF